MGGVQKQRRKQKKQKGEHKRSTTKKTKGTKCSENAGRGERRGGREAGLKNNPKQKWHSVLEWSNKKEGRREGGQGRKVMKKGPKSRYAVREGSKKVNKNTKTRSENAGRGRREGERE